MNREHLWAFLWLRWRLLVNQFWKAGTLNAIFFFVFVGCTLLAAVGLFVTGLLVGALALPGSAPGAQLLVWDGAIAAFLVFWLLGLLTDLQRAEGLAIDKVLHLPVSPTGAFLINYLSSLFSLTLVAFLPGMVGLVLGQVSAGSSAALLALPLLAAFVLAVTGVTYQFQGWLAALLANPRRRRTVMVFITGGLILVAQLPSLVNLIRPWENGTRTEESNRSNVQRAADQADLNANKITPEEKVRQEEQSRQAWERTERKRSVESRSRPMWEWPRQTWEPIERTARLVSLVLPPGWLAIGAADLSTGAVLPALLGTLGLGAIGAASLWRAHRTTIRLYTGAFTGQGQRAPARPVSPTDLNRVRLLEWRLPRVSEHASAVALAAFRSLAPAPEAKMALVPLLFIFVMFVGASLSVKEAPPPALRPLMALGAGVLVIFVSGVQLVGNQFGYDRAGFRAYVLSPIPRREILLGKNLAIAPLGLGMGLVVVLLIGTAFPMRVDHYPAVVAQLVSAYLLFCLLANGLSILAPIPMAAGSMQPSQINAIPALLQMALVMVLPLALMPVLIPLGIEVLLAEAAEVEGVPVALVLSVFVLAATVFVYRRVLTREGDWLAAREQTILETVTGKG